MGADVITPALQRVVDGLRAKLTRSGVAPVAVELDFRTVTFVFDDVTAETVVMAGELLPKSQEVEMRRYYFTTRTAGRETAVGSETVPADVQRAIDLFTDRLARNDLAAVGVTYTVDPRTKYRTATFDFYTPFRAERAAELLPSGYKTGAQMLYLKTRVIPETEVGGVPFAIARQIEALADLLVQHDAAPAGHRYEPDALTFLFHTPFRAKRAREILPPSFEVDGRPIYVYAALRDDVAVGQIVGTAQSTPWTCGPAALRAVLAHHGIDIAEDELAVLAGNVPVLGVRPSGLVKAAVALGCHASVFVMRGVDALAPFLAQDLPVLLVVDSWTQPGKAGHWVVATALAGDQVRLMDPHVTGEWRTLTKAELDARWWHREGGRVVRRLALVVAPEARVVVGGEAAPAHGRTANLVYKGMPKWLDVMGKVQRGVTKALVTAFSGGTAAGAVDAVQDQLMSAAGKMNAKEFATWLNNATNEEVAALRLGQIRKQVKEARGDKAALLGRLGLTAATLDGPLAEALTALLREELFAYGTAPMVPPQQQLHSLQALAILLYGVEVLPLLDARLKARPQVKDWKKDPGLTTVLDWANVTLAVLDKFSDDHEAGAKEFA